MRFITSFFLFTAALVSITPVNAQQFRFGAEVGAGYSSYSYNSPLPIWDLGGRTSFNGGLIFQRDLSRLIGLESGVRISLLRNKVQLLDTEFSPGLEGSYSVAQTYVSVPVHLLVRPTKGQTFVFVGPEVSYILSAIIHVDAPEDDEVNSSVDGSNIVDTIERPGFFLGFGVGHELSLGKKQIHLRLAYNLGLTSTGRDESEWASSWKARDLSIRIGYFL